MFIVGTCPAPAPRTLHQELQLRKGWALVRAYTVRMIIHGTSEGLGRRIGDTEEKKRAPFESGDQNHADVRNVAVLSSASNTDAPAAAHADPLGPEKCPI